MSECPCDHEKIVDPLCCAAGMCARETEEIDMERAELGVDGNCGFALLGENLQEGEAEFVEFKWSGAVGSTDWAHNAKIAATQAYRKLKDRLSNRAFSYYLGPSHPDYV